MTLQNKLTKLQDCIIHTGSDKNYPLYDAAKLITLRGTQNTERTELSCIDRELIDQWGFEKIEKDHQFKRARASGIVQENEIFPHYLICPDYTILQVYATDIKKLRSDFLFFLQTQFQKQGFGIGKEKFSSAKNFLNNLVRCKRGYILHNLSENVRSVLHLSRYDETLDKSPFNRKVYYNKYGQAAHSILRNPINAYLEIYFGWGIGDDHGPIIGASIDAALSCKHYFWERNHFTLMYLNPHSRSDIVELVYDKDIDKEIEESKT